MQTRAVEPGGHRKFDVALQRRVGRSRPDAVGIESLIEHQPLVIGFVVQVDPVPFDVDLAHARIGVHLVEHLPFRIHDPVGDVVEKRRLRRPEFRTFDGKHGDRTVRGPHRRGGHDLAALLHRDMQRVAALRPEAGRDDQLPLVDVRHHVRREQPRRVHGLHPHRLPDTRGAGVVAAVGGVLQILFAGALRRRAHVARGSHDQMVALSGRDQTGQIDAERRTAPDMAGGENAIDIDLRIVVDGPEIQQNVLSAPRFGHRHLAVVPDAVDEIGVPDAREGALGTERHRDPALESGRLLQSPFQSRPGEVERIVPHPVEIHPRRPFELRPRVLPAGNIRSIRLKHRSGEKQRRGQKFRYLHIRFTCVVPAPGRGAFHSGCKIKRFIALSSSLFRQKIAFFAQLIERFA